MRVLILLMLAALLLSSACWAQNYTFMGIEACYCKAHPVIVEHEQDSCAVADSAYHAFAVGSFWVIDTYPQLIDVPFPEWVLCLHEKCLPKFFRDLRIHDSNSERFKVDIDTASTPQWCLDKVRRDLVRDSIRLDPIIRAIIRDELKKAFRARVVPGARYRIVVEEY